MTHRLTATAPATAALPRLKQDKDLSGRKMPGKFFYHGNIRDLRYIQWTRGMRAKEVERQQIMMYEIEFC